MLPKLLSLLGALLSIGQLAMDTYVQVRKIFPSRKRQKLTVVEIRRLEELRLLYPRFLNRGEQDEFLDLENRLFYSQE